MDGALGVRPLLDVSLETTLMDELNVNLSLYGLWACDTLKALATPDFSILMKAELNFETKQAELRKAILETDYKGMSGNFSLKQEQLEPSQFVVYNMKGQRGKYHRILETLNRTIKL
ncbi:hypothetical protein K1719_013019 [Acacia pycnantha]|nr:hypothetical protein K1719_013019 [Acacia pycnantha]